MYMVPVRALAEIAKRIKGKREVTPKSVNLLGVTPLDFGPQEHVDALIQNVEQAGWKVLSTWAMGDTLENLARAPEAEVNLVVSSDGTPGSGKYCRKDSGRLM